MFAVFFNVHCLPFFFCSRQEAAPSKRFIRVDAPCVSPKQRSVLGKLQLCGPVHAKKKQPVQGEILWITQVHLQKKGYRSKTTDPAAVPRAQIHIYRSAPPRVEARYAYGTQASPIETNVTDGARRMRVSVGRGGYVATWATAPPVIPSGSWFMCVHTHAHACTCACMVGCRWNVQVRKHLDSKDDMHLLLRDQSFAQSATF